MCKDISIEKFAKSDPAILSTNHSHQMDKVLKEDYVYIIDSTSADYVVGNCNYTVLPDHFDFFFQYSLGFRQKSAYTDPFTLQ